MNRPERGWDPVRAEWAEEYAEYAWNELVDEATIDWVERTSGSLKGLEVLDLGGGPGQYSAALARRGAKVTWHDVSARYRDIAQRRTRAAGAEVRFSVGYLEDAAKFGRQSFDLVFCRSCWYYAVADRPLTRIIHELIRPGGTGFVNCPLSSGPGGSVARRVQVSLYEDFGFKVGHPMPPPGRLAEAFGEYPIEDLQVRTLPKNEEEILFRKPARC